MKTEILKILHLTAIGLGLYAWAADMATAQRGYSAYGGEVAFLFLPLLWGIGKRIIKDWAAEIKEIMRDER